MSVSTSAFPAYTVPPPVYNTDFAMQVKVISGEKRWQCGEGPHWDSRRALLWHVDVHAGLVCHLDPQTASTETKHLGGSFASLVVPFQAEVGQEEELLLVVSRDRQLLWLDWKSGQSRVIAEPEEGSDTRFNDGKCDATGRLWAGTMGLEESPAVVQTGKGSLYSLQSGRVRHQLAGISISNGLAWTRDGTVMFYIDSYARNVVAFDFDSQLGEMAKGRTLVELGSADGYPDGMCIDSQDNIWVACFGGSKVLKIDTQTGKRLETVTLPTPKITSCCFGGPDYQDLYVTSARGFLPDTDPEPLAGAIFKVTELGAKGLPANTFRG